MQFTSPKRAFLAAIIALTAAGATSAQELDTAQKLITTRNAHKLLSDLTTNSGIEYLYYEVCNPTDALSSFHWHEPGFGVENSDPMAPRGCATRTINAPHDRVFKDNTTIEFHLTYADVPAYLLCFEAVDDNQCNAGWLRRFYESFFELITPPKEGSPAQMVTLTITAKIPPGGGCVHLVVEASEGLKYVLLVFPAEDLDALSELFKESGDQIEIDTFSYFAKEERLTAELLTKDFQHDSPVVRIRRITKEGESQPLTFSALTQLRTKIVALAGNDAGLVVRNDVNVCASSAAAADARR